MGTLYLLKKCPINLFVGRNFSGTYHEGSPESGLPCMYTMNCYEVLNYVIIAPSAPDIRNYVIITQLVLRTFRVWAAKILNVPRWDVIFYQSVAYWPKRL